MSMKTMTSRQEKAAAKKASNERMAQAHLEAQTALSANKCPCCGAAVHSNLALTGWVQCNRYGSPGFRRDETGAQCSWQGFTR